MYSTVERGTKVGIPEEVLGLVIGKKRSNFNRIEKETGAKIEVFDRKDVYVTGGPQECKNAIKQLKTSAYEGVHSNWLKSNFTCDTYNFVDGSGRACEYRLDSVECPNQEWHQDKDYFKIKRVDEEDHMASDGEMGDLNNKIHEVLQKIQDFDGSLSGEMPKADFWCHFGHLYITGNVDEDEQDRIYSLKDFQSKFNNENGWRMVFNNAVKDMNVQELEEALLSTKYQKIPPHIRYDMCLLTPSCTRIRVKFYLDLNGEPNVNFVNQFLDNREVETSKYVFCDPFIQRAKVSISIPAYNMDVRITIRTVSSTVDMEHNEHEEIIKKYLDKITFKGQEIILPDDKDMPDDFVLQFIRKCNRRYYSYTGREEDTFTILVSEEQEMMDGTGEIKTDIHLYSDQCNQLLRSGNWQPEQITRKLPTFLLALRDIQDNINSIKT